MTFQSLHIKPPLLQTLETLEYLTPTIIQQKLIPEIFSGHDILAGAQTGTGKTAGYALPILQDLAGKYEDGKHYPKALILAPTRELVKQIKESFCSYGQSLPLYTAGLYGGVKFDTQARTLHPGGDIVISTPGRLIEHLGAKTLSLDAVKFLVLDEADTILDMGFIREVSQTLHALPPKRQNILISATLSTPLKRLAEKLLIKPKHIEVDAMGTVAQTVTQYLYPVEADKKIELLSYLIGSKNHPQALVFVRKKVEAQNVADGLSEAGLETSVIHGDKTSGERNRAIEKFKKGEIRVLVATDIAARGLDIPTLEAVFSFDIPHVLQDYIHRIGRTGRAGRAGEAFVLVSPLESVALKDLERLLGKKIPRVVLEEYAPKTPEEPQKRKRSVSEKIAGAFGKKREKTPTTTKKRKTTKRDGFKTAESKPTKKKKGR